MSTPEQTSSSTVRRTLARAAFIEGIALFTGAPSAITINPSGPTDPDGIWFVCAGKDGSGGVPIPASFSHIVPESRRTVLAQHPLDPSSPSVQTVEHVLSALTGLGITDVQIEVRGPEIPLGDGSAKPFVDAILAAGTRTLPVRGDRRDGLAPLVVKRRVELIDPRDASVRIVAEPLGLGDAPGLHVRYNLDYAAARTGIDLQQTYSFAVEEGGRSAHEYAGEVAPARTFCTFAEAEAMRKMGLFLHLTARDMLVLGPGGVPIENTLRAENEPARHKVLDMIGDLALAGAGARPIIGRIEGTKTGHSHNHQMARAIWELFSQG